jgi:hypothetical protein
MKKLMILGLLAGSSMFAATRFSIGVHIGTPAPVYTAPVPAYGYGYVAPTYVAPRYDTGWRDWDRNHYRQDRDDRGRNHDRDDHRGRSNDFRRR